MKNIMYIVVNKDLDMSVGKIAAQVSHAVYDYLYNEYEAELIETGETDFYYWKMRNFKEDGDTICILKASEKELSKFQKEGYTTVIDRGYTEIPKDSITAVNLGIYDRERPNDIPKFIRRLRLL